MFIERHGQSLKNAKDSIASNGATDSGITTANGKVLVAQDILSDFVELNNSYIALDNRKNLLVTAYNNLYDRFTCNVRSYNDFDNKDLLSTGIMQIADLSFPKSYETELILDLALTFRHRSYDGNTFKLYYDIGTGNGWQLWATVYYRLINYSQHYQLYEIFTNVPAQTLQIKVGIEDLSGDVNRTELINLNFIVSENR